MTLTGISLFAGVGGFDIALERAGVNVVAACEIDANARGVLAHRFPNTQLFDDVRTLTGDQLIGTGFDPGTGIIVGGFPCQDLSVAGKRAGLDGARSGLFFEIVRLLDETKVRFFILENVPGLLSSNRGGDMAAVIGALAELGYGIAYRVLDAQYFGVPQRRRRVFIVGCLGDDGRTPSEILAISEGRERYFAQGATKGQDIASTLGGGSGSRGWSSDTDRMTFVPVSFRKSRRAQTATDDETWVSSSVTNTLNAFDIGDTRATELAVAFHQKQNPISGAISPALGMTSAGMGVHTRSIVRRLTPIECERLQGFPDGWTAQRHDFKKNAVVDQADSSRYKQMGNAVAVPVVVWIAKRLIAAIAMERAA